MAKKLSCWIGRHDLTTRVEQGESYQVCPNCGKTQRDKQGRGSDLPGWSGETGSGGGGGPSDGGSGGGPG